MPTSVNTNENKNSRSGEWTDHTEPESLSDKRRRWSRLLHLQHYQPVIEEVLSEELPKYQHSTIIKAADRVTYMHECALILASAPSVLVAAVDGNLVKRMLQDTQLQREYVSIQERAHEQPSIYIHLLTDSEGNGPTPNQYLVIRNIVLDYITAQPSSEHAWHIDNMTSPTVTKKASTQGHRKYLHTTTRSTHRVQALHRFCAGILNRHLETPPHLHDTPVQHPPGECGYSKDSHKRLAQHRAHHSSNYIMNLVEDICTYLHRAGTFPQHFLLHQFIIYLIFRPSQAAIAEIFCSGLLQVWVEGGGGFNAYPAGRSVSTARRVNAGEWEAHEAWVRETSAVEGCMRGQRERAEEWLRALRLSEAAFVDEEGEGERMQE
ncbi:hypothetical protein ACN47E_003513 [Coniothyrium glycines]